MELFRRYAPIDYVFNLAAKVTMTISLNDQRLDLQAYTVCIFNVLAAVWPYCPLVPLLIEERQIMHNKLISNGCN